MYQDTTTRGSSQVYVLSLLNLGTLWFLKSMIDFALNPCMISKSVNLQTAQDEWIDSETFPTSAYLGEGG
jgi:hypothetical protein